MTLNEADQVVHPVEKEWHYPIMTDAGWTTEDREGIGFVRGYVYSSPDGTRKIRVKTGVSCDYWTDIETQASGYWGSLAKYVSGADMGKPGYRGMY